MVFPAEAVVASWAATRSIGYNRLPNTSDAARFLIMGPPSFARHPLRSMVREWWVSSKCRSGNGIFSNLMSAPLMPADRWGERLVRRLGLWSAVAVLVGSTIGSGIFRTPASVAQRIDDVPLFLLAWVVGGVVGVCGALTYSELAAAFPRSGGVYVFVRESFGPLPAFLFAWAELWIIRPGAFGAIGITASAYTLRTLGHDPATEVLGSIRAEQLLGASYILLVGAVNYMGIHRGAILQNLSTAFKVGALAPLVIVGFAFGTAGTRRDGGMFRQRGSVCRAPFLIPMVAVRC